MASRASGRVSCVSHRSRRASSSMYQTEAARAPGLCVAWACHVINTRLDLLHLIKAIPSGEQTSMSQRETRPRREGDHTATLARAWGRADPLTAL